MVLTRIIFAPHPDDEVLSSGGLIQQSLDAGINIIIVYMTDGRACYLAIHLETEKNPTQVALIRKREALEGCNILNIPVSNLQFLDFPDQQLRDHYTQALEEVKVIIRSFSRVDVFIPVGQNPHIDHQATHNIVVQAIEELQRDDIPIYQYGLHRNVRGKADLKVKLTPQMLQIKIQAYNCHQSQKFAKINDIAAQNDEERFVLLKK